MEENMVPSDDFKEKKRIACTLSANKKLDTFDFAPFVKYLQKY